MKMVPLKKEMAAQSVGADGQPGALPSTNILPDARQNQLETSIPFASVFVNPDILREVVYI